MSHSSFDDRMTPLKAFEKFKKQHLAQKEKRMQAYKEKLKMFGSWDALNAFESWALTVTEKEADQVIKSLSKQARS